MSWRTKPPRDDDGEERAAHRAAVDELQDAIDATMHDGADEGLRRIDLREAQQREAEAHSRLQRKRERASR